ncbi:hypothetical protein AVEN_81907-1 [Araneus ventricosus]|uniref:Uncharacterized protein n=1 Tax=Araneus ventricosus TaxID=182803 RepID=A0A4Y2MDZ5_ARAVE|nr:hypothetical protein AVEN_81907-1 [Araneus ventricosus]
MIINSPYTKISKNYHRREKQQHRFKWLPQRRLFEKGFVVPVLARIYQPNQEETDVDDVRIVGGIWASYLKCYTKALDLSCYEIAFQTYEFTRYSQLSLISLAYAMSHPLLIMVPASITNEGTKTAKSIVMILPYEIPTSDKELKFEI